MKIEVLFPEICNLYGDLQNIMYLKRCIESVEIINTSLNQEPYFVKENVNLIYLGSMTERSQEKVIDKLKPYKERIEELIEKNVVFLFTGNALEIVSKYIENEDGTKIEALNIFDIYSKRNMLNRYNGKVLGKFKDIDIIGFKSTFSFSYGNNENNYFLKVDRGIGLNSGSKFEGIMKNNFIGTYLLGPILIINPLFTRYIMKLIGVNNPKLKFEKISMEAYEEKITNF